MFTSGSAHIASTLWKDRALKSCSKRARASGRGSTAAARRTRGCCTSVGSISMKARPNPATPIRSTSEELMADTPLDVQHKQVGLRAGDADHDFMLPLVLRQDEVAVIHVAL